MVSIESTESIFVHALMTSGLPSSRELCRRDAGGPWLKPLGSGRFGKYSCLFSASSDRLDRSIPSEAGKPSTRGLSNFRCLFLRARGCPNGSAEFGFIGRDVEGHGDRLRTERPMHKRNAVPLRLAFSAAGIGGVLAAATFSGAHRAGSLVGQTVRETEPILVGSISTIKNPGGEKAGTRR